MIIQICKTVISHEAGMRAQAKKMNVESLKQTDANAESAEMKIAKVSNPFYQDLRSATQGRKYMSLA